MHSFSYVGSELDLFSAATNWKTYYTQMIKPYLGRSVLEVGAGIGMTTQYLCSGDHDRWVCLEPDPMLADHIEDRIKQGHLAPGCQVKVGTLENLSDHEKFHAILYVDVLEHIEDDAAQLERAANHLLPDGHLIVLAPAHGFLYSEFDEAVGHYRRYTGRTLSAAAPDHLGLIFLRYLDSAGLLLSLGNTFLKKSLPEKWHIGFWNRFVVPVSVWVDWILGYRIGKTVLAVWKKVSHP